jgi:hypothetical protein
MSYCVRLHPDEDKQNVLLGGMANKKVMQWDMDTGDMVQEYDYHLGAINTITFIDQNRRFVSTSGDCGVFGAGGWWCRGDGGGLGRECVCECVCVGVSCTVCAGIKLQQTPHQYPLPLVLKPTMTWLPVFPALPHCR